MSQLKPTIGKRVTLTLLDGSVIKGCWFQYDGSFAVSNPFLQVPANETIYIGLRDVKEITDESA